MLLKVLIRGVPEDGQRRGTGQQDGNKMNRVSREYDLQNPLFHSDKFSSLLKVVEVVAKARKAQESLQLACRGMVTQNLNNPAKTGV